MRKNASTKKASEAKSKRIFNILAAVVVLVFFVLMMTVPEFEKNFYKFIGAADGGGEAALLIESDTKIHVIDVGQGDATLLERNGHFALIDAGPPEAKDDLIAYLKEIDVKKLDYVVMSHPHADHIGGMLEVLENFSVGTIILPDFTKAPYPTSRVFIKLLEYIASAKITAKTAKVGDVYPLENSTITVLQAGIEDDDNYNYLSLIVMFEADGVRMITSGDAEKANEKALVASGMDISADILIVGHHGSSTSNTGEFLRAVNPRMAVISCAKDNSYGHPHKEVVQSLKDMRIQYFRTDEEGSVVLGILENGKIQYCTRAMVKEEKTAFVAAVYALPKRGFQTLR